MSNIHKEKFQKHFMKDRNIQITPPCTIARSNSNSETIWRCDQIMLHLKKNKEQSLDIGNQD